MLSTNSHIEWKNYTVGDQISSLETRDLNKNNNDMETFEAHDYLRASHDDTAPIPSVKIIVEPFESSIRTPHIVSLPISSKWFR